MGYTRDNVVPAKFPVHASCCNQAIRRQHLAVTLRIKLASNFKLITGLVGLGRLCRLVLHFEASDVTVRPQQHHLWQAVIGGWVFFEHADALPGLRTWQ